MDIKPEDVDTSQHFWTAFGKSETEISAIWIVRFCQERGRGWEPFERKEIEEFYGRKHKDGFTFNGTYYITSTFVGRLPVKTESK